MEWAMRKGKNRRENRVVTGQGKEGGTGEE